MLSFQVLLDRLGFSPGEINAQRNPNFDHALAAFQSTHGLDARGEPDCSTWQALGGDTAEPASTSYALSEEDMQGPFERVIPRDLVRQGHLPFLGYRSVLEMIAERFHVSPHLLRELNPQVAFGAGSRGRQPGAEHLEAGATILVPAVTPFDPEAKPDLGHPADVVTIVVSRNESSLRALRADGSLAFFAPVSSGSDHDPLPLGDWKVSGVKWHPVFHYNPNLFWDAKPNRSRADIKPGPNNPVGVVWIALDLEHYGLHGTPEPSRVGYGQSHGCVRLTNWDAVRVAIMVKPGTSVQFRQ